MIREALDQWDFVFAAYAVGIVGIMAMTGWAWLAMRRAEHRRDLSRERSREP